MMMSGIDQLSVSSDVQRFFTALTFLIAVNESGSMLGDELFAKLNFSY